MKTKYRMIPWHVSMEGNLRFHIQEGVPGAFWSKSYRWSNLTERTLLLREAEKVLAELNEFQSKEGHHHDT